MDIANRIAEYNLPVWQEKILNDSLENEFINDVQLEKAVEIIKRFKNEDELFDACSISRCEISQSLANASQI